MQINLTGKVALVTGAGQGVGRAIALTLAEAGATVALNDINGPAIEDVAAAIRAAGGAASAYTADITEQAAVQAMVARIGEELGPPAILVNNAGLWVTGPFVQSSRAGSEREIGLNLYGVIFCTHAVLPGMIERRDGRIISITSDAGRVGEPNLAVYSAAKAGVIGLTRAVAKEVGRYGITVNAVALATTRTPATESTMLADAAQVERITRLYPLRRLGEPEDAANAVAFLASEQAAWVTGQTWGVDGGYATN